MSYTMAQANQMETDVQTVLQTITASGIDKSDKIIADYLTVNTFTSQMLYSMRNPSQMIIDSYCGTIQSLEKYIGTYYYLIRGKYVINKDAKAASGMGILGNYTAGTPVTGFAAMISSPWFIIGISAVSAIFLIKILQKR
jgi:hypothetical protein